MWSGDGSRLHSIKCSRKSQWITETDCSSSIEVSGEQTWSPTSFRVVSKVDAWPMKLLLISRRWQQVSEWENSADHWCRRLAYLSLSCLVQRSIQRRRQQRKAFDSFFIDLDHEQDFLPEESYSMNDIHVLYRFIHDHSLAHQCELHSNQILILTDEHETNHRSRLANASIWLCTTFNEVSLVQSFLYLHSLRCLDQKWFVGMYSDYSSARSGQRNISSSSLRSAAREQSRLSREIIHRSVPIGNAEMHPDVRDPLSFEFDRVAVFFSLKKSGCCSDSIVESFLSAAFHRAGDEDLFLVLTSWTLSTWSGNDDRRCSTETRYLSAPSIIHQWFMRTNVNQSNISWL